MNSLETMRIYKGNEYPEKKKKTENESQSDISHHGNKCVGADTYHVCVVYTISYIPCRYIPYIYRIYHVEAIFF